MDSHALEYYSAYSDKNVHGHFHKVIPLHEDKHLSWKRAKELSPTLAKGWFELAHLSIEDRIQFVHDFWLSQLPYNPHLRKALDKFFLLLDDIGIFLTQDRNDDPYKPQMIYSFADNSGFFHGYPSASDDEILALQKEFTGFILPPDYFTFLQIHNGFAKLTDSGILKSTEVKPTYLAFQEMLANEEEIKSSQMIVNPKSLIPFYKSFDMPFFQCFWGEWGPENEMGNVYYSGITKTISDCTKADRNVETMAFETFTDWLIFYLEKIG